MANNPLTKSPQGRPVDMLGTMRDEMDRLFERFEQGWPRLPGLFAREGGGMVPQLDVKENAEQLSIEVELPGVEEKDVSVTLSNGILSIKGEKRSSREEKKDNYHLAERSFGSFERSLRLPETIDEGKVEARFDKGVLHITAAKKAEAVKSERRIPIGSA